MDNNLETNTNFDSPLGARGHMETNTNFDSPPAGGLGVLSLYSSSTEIASVDCT